MCEERGRGLWRKASGADRSSLYIDPGKSEGVLEFFFKASVGTLLEVYKIRFIFFPIPFYFFPNSVFSVLIFLISVIFLFMLILYNKKVSDNVCNLMGYNSPFSGLSAATKKYCSI